MPLSLGAVTFRRPYISWAVFGLCYISAPLCVVVPDLARRTLESEPRIELTPRTLESEPRIDLVPRTLENELRIDLLLRTLENEVR